MGVTDLKKEKVRLSLGIVGLGEKKGISITVSMGSREKTRDWPVALFAKDPIAFGRELGEWYEQEAREAFLSPVGHEFEVARPWIEGSPRGKDRNLANNVADFCFVMVQEFFTNTMLAGGWPTKVDP